MQCIFAYKCFINVDIYTYLRRLLLLNISLFIFYLFHLKKENRVEKTKTTNKRKNDFIAMKQSTLKTYLLEKYLDIYF